MTKRDGKEKFGYRRYGTINPNRVTRFMQACNVCLGKADWQCVSATVDMTYWVSIAAFFGVDRHVPKSCNTGFLYIYQTYTDIVWCVCREASFTISFVRAVNDQTSLYRCVCQFDPFKFIAFAVESRCIIFCGCLYLLHICLPVWNQVCHFR